MAPPAALHRYSFADSVAVSSALLAQLRGGPCRVHSSNLRVRVLATGLATYPDVTVVCGDVEGDPESPTTVVNPRGLIVDEVYLGFRTWPRHPGHGGSFGARPTPERLGTTARPVGPGAG